MYLPGGRILFMFNTAANVPRDEIQSRISRLQRNLQRQNIDGALILQNTDLYYLCGTIQQSHLYIPAVGDPVLMVRKNVVILTGN